MTSQPTSSQTDVKIETVEAHSAGQPIRIVTDGVDYPKVPNGDVTAIRDEFAESADHIRRLLNLTPRGHDDLVCSFPVPPGDDRADLGLFFTDNDGYLEMCGDATIGTVSAFVKMGRLPTAESFTVETPIGLVDVAMTYDEGMLCRATVDGITSFVSDRTTVTIPIDGEPTTVPVCISFAGHFYGLVDVTKIESSLMPDARDIDHLRRLGMAIRSALNEQTITNPVTDEPNSVEVILFYEDHESEPDDNLIVYGDGAVGLGPCGTGTCAKMAKLYAEDRLAIDENYPHRGPLRTKYVGRLSEATPRDDETVLRASVGGLGYVTGQQTIQHHPDDAIDGASL